MYRLDYDQELELVMDRIVDSYGEFDELEESATTAFLNREKEEMREIRSYVRDLRQDFSEFSRKVHGEYTVNAEEEVRLEMEVDPGSVDSGSDFFVKYIAVLEMWEEFEELRSSVEKSARILEEQEF